MTEVADGQRDVLAILQSAHRRGKLPHPAKVYAGWAERDRTAAASETDPARQAALTERAEGFERRAASLAEVKPTTVDGWRQRFAQKGMIE